MIFLVPSSPQVSLLGPRRDGMCGRLLLLRTKALMSVSVRVFTYDTLEMYLVRLSDFAESICNRSFELPAAVEPNSLISMKVNARFWWLVKVRVRCKPEWGKLYNLTCIEKS